MKCERVVFSVHAMRRMLQRGAGPDTVNAVISGGETAGCDARSDKVKLT